MMKAFAKLLLVTLSVSACSDYESRTNFQGAPGGKIVPEARVALIAPDKALEAPIRGKVFFLKRLGDPQFPNCARLAVAEIEQGKTSVRAFSKDLFQGVEISSVEAASRSGRYVAVVAGHRVPNGSAPEGPGGHLLAKLQIVRVKDGLTIEGSWSEWVRPYVVWHPTKDILYGTLQSWNYGPHALEPAQLVEIDPSKASMRLLDANDQAPRPVIWQNKLYLARRDANEVTLVQLNGRGTEKLPRLGTSKISPSSRRAIHEEGGSVYGWNGQESRKLMSDAFLATYPRPRTEWLYADYRQSWSWSPDGASVAIFYWKEQYGKSDLQFRCTMFRADDWHKLFEVALTDEWGMVEWTRDGRFLICQRFDAAGRVVLAALDRDGKMYSLTKDLGKVSGYVDWWEPPTPGW